MVGAVHEEASSLSQSERRGSARGPLYTLVQSGDGQPWWAWDIGLGGMHCQTRAPRWPGTYLDLEFTLPETSDRLRTGAQVVSLDRQPQGDLSLGLRFCRLTARAQLAIYRFLDRRRVLWERPPELRPARLMADLAARHPALAPLLLHEQPFRSLLLEAQARLQLRLVPRMI